MQYLHEEKYYTDLYDLHTIEECLDWYFRLKKGMDEKREELNYLSSEEFDKETHKAVSYTVNVLAIQRYRRKAERIREWMDKDRKVQEKVDNAKAPEEIFCKECFSRTKVVSKDLFDSYSEDSQVMFTFECVKCNKRQSLYEDGTDWTYEPPKCPQCNSPLKDKVKRTKNILKITYSCSNCSYKKEDVHDFKKSEAERKKKSERDKKLLELYRKDFCLDDKEGKEAVNSLDLMVKLAGEMKVKEQKDKDPVYQKARKLRTLKIGQLKELLEKTIEKEHYQDLAFAKPEMG